MLILRTIDKCINNNWSGNAACYATTEGFGCNCHPGFTGNGFTCTGKYRVRERRDNGIIENGKVLMIFITYQWVWEQQL